MAVYTDVAAEELAAFLAGYDIGELLAYKGIAEGVENSNFLLHTSQGNFILTLYEKRVAPEDLPFFLGLMEHLAARGLTCPQPVKNRSGNMIGRLAGRPAAIVTVLDGISVHRPSAVHCMEVGKGLAKLHLAGGDFRMQRRNALSVDGWRPLYVAAAAGADSVQPGLRDAIERDHACGHHGKAQHHCVPASDANADDTRGQCSDHAANGPGDESDSDVFRSHTETLDSVQRIPRREGLKSELQKQDGHEDGSHAGNRATNGRPCCLCE